LLLTTPTEQKWTHFCQYQLSMCSTRSLTLVSAMHITHKGHSPRQSDPCVDPSSNPARSLNVLKHKYTDLPVFTLLGLRDWPVTRPKLLIRWPLTYLLDWMPWRRWRLISALRQLQLHKIDESVTSNQICPWPVCLRREVWVVGWLRNPVPTLVFQTFFKVLNNYVKIDRF